MGAVRNAIAILLAVFSVSALAGGWPALPKQGFIVGRAATAGDVKAGNAAFVAARGGVSIGKPLTITIPQYAYFRDGAARLPVIVIQAEEADGKKLLGARTLDGKDVVGLISDFELLGNALPKSAP